VYPTGTLVLLFIFKKEIMLKIQNLSYIHPNKEVMFDNLHLTLHKQSKAALIGNNGSGKSTLLKLVAGALQPSGGSIQTDVKPYYLPQIAGQWNDYTVARALQIEDKLHALHEILAGQATEANLALLDGDWNIEEHCLKALQHWGLEDLNPGQSLATLSGGQKTKVFLAGIQIHQPGMILMDEPSNHLDTPSRQQLYELIKTTSATLLVVSHDRTLLNLLHPAYELSTQGISTYGGNYDFYAEQKSSETQLLGQKIRSQEKGLRKAKEVEKDSLAKQQKLDARGKRKQEKAGLPTISMKTFRNNAEKSTARIKNVHAGKVDDTLQELNRLKDELPAADKIKLNLDHSGLHKGKILVAARNINFGYTHEGLWSQPLSFALTSGDRAAIKGPNGSGKTTLMKMIHGTISPGSGVISRTGKATYIDQDYSLLTNQLTVYEQAERFNSGALQDHEIKTLLSRFLFTKQHWNRHCVALSGGEKMRLLLCCLNIDRQPPDLILLDEPTNNLDLQNVEILTAAMNGYQGTLLVVSHDEHFLEEIQLTQVIHLE
jgi:ATPase subunit of ABC transporter with duplicated ATPase domains